MALTLVSLNADEKKTGATTFKNEHAATVVGNIEQPTENTGRIKSAEYTNKQFIEYNQVSILLYLVLFF